MGDICLKSDILNVKQRRNFNTITVKQIVCFFLFLVSKRAVVKNQIQNKSLRSAYQIVL